VIHSDLKVRNVLLKSDGSDGRGVVAKVADFGLAVRIESQDTHVSAFQGTLSHMVRGRGGGTWVAGALGGAASTADTGPPCCVVVAGHHTHTNMASKHT
jgi:serine/threonine protein kinase